jgi:hypothetical protein
MQANTNTKTQAIELTFEPQAGYWLMDGKGPPDYPTLVVPMNHKGQFTFTIKDTPGVTFGSPAFVKKTGKPDPGDFGSQFQQAKPNGKTLVVTDANANQNGQPYGRKDYHYELRFTNDVPLDPIITNMGCCQRDYGAYYAIGAGIALVASYYFFIRPWLQRRSAAAARDRNQL